MILASIPSPSVGVWWLGPIPIRAYGILTVCAMALAAWVCYKRYTRRGGVGDVAYDSFFFAVVFGIIGARLYHVLTHPADYFGEGADPWSVFRIWEGGQAIWGALGLGAVGVIYVLRRNGQRAGPFADSLAPGMLLAQVLGRLGNYMNQELFGGPTTLPWGLEIDPQNMPPGYPPGTLFHPTFLYEGLWNLVGAFLLLYLDKRIRFKSGQVMALYLVVYGSGRFWIESLRVDFSYVFLGIRTNAWTALFAVVLGIVIFFIAGRIGAPTRVTPEERYKYYELRAERRGEPIPEAEILVSDAQADLNTSEENPGSVSTETDSDRSEG